MPLRFCSKRRDVWLRNCCKAIVAKLYLEKILLTHCRQSSWSHRQRKPGNSVASSAAASRRKTLPSIYFTCQCWGCRTILTYHFLDDKRKAKSAHCADISNCSRSSESLYTPSPSPRPLNRLALFLHIFRVFEDNPLQGFSSIRQVCCQVPLVCGRILRMNATIRRQFVNPVILVCVFASHTVA